MPLSLDTDSTGAAIDADSEEELAYVRALKALGRKERTVAEMRSWLSNREFSANAVEAVVHRLIDAGALDDARFAEHFTDDKRRLSGWGNERIRQTLLRRGAPSDDIEAAVGEEDAETEAARAASVIESRGFSLADDRDRGRVLGFLVRRGYRYEVAYEAIRRLAT